MENIIILIIVFAPIIGSALAWLGDLMWKKWSQVISILSVGSSAVLSVYAFILMLTGNWVDPDLSTTTWILNPVYDIKLVLAPDTLGIFIAMIASFLGLLIVLFSIEYMDNDSLTRYWFYMQLFIGGMVLLALAQDLVLLYIGWETVGLCSFGLISHWHTKDGEQGQKAALSGIKAFIFTRIGDIGLLVAIVIIYTELGAVDYQSIAAQVGILSANSLQVIGFCFMLAAFGKSAQFPFIPWLSSPDSVDIDAMQGPTTVSALIHAATMVKAGVYLMARAYLLFPLWNIKYFATTFVWIAGITAFIAACSALVSFDIKRILAFSTVSQLAYMFLAVAMSVVARASSLTDVAATSFLNGQYHLISHAIFKSLLFLTAGYIIHKHNFRDIRELRGVAGWQVDAVAFIGVLSGGLSLAGIPPFIGFFSKEGLLGTLEGSMGDDSLFVVGYVFGLLTAVITALYVGRFLYYLISGRESHENTASHSSSVIMQVVIVLLSALALAGGFIQLILSDYFKPLLGTVYFHSLFGENLIVTLSVTIGIAVFTFLSYYLMLIYPQFSTKLGNVIFIKQFIAIAASGFYLEQLWQIGWQALKYTTYKFRRLHTGNVNDLVLSSMIVSLGIVAYIGGLTL